MTRSTPALLLLCVFALGCPQNDDGTTDGDTDGTDFVCDPVGDQPEMNGLFNAPVGDDVEVIEKTPRHPGDPGPEDLP